MERELISVIVPVYNGAAYLAQAIESALGQTYAPLEIIVIDDGSTDDSAAVAARYPMVQYEFQTNAGIGAARNRGIAHANGQILALLDADDVWLPDKLAQQAAALYAPPYPELVFGYVQEFVSPELPEELRAILPYDVQPKAGMLPSAALLRRSAFERVGPFGTQWVAGEFAEWMLRANECGLQRVMLPGVMVRRRIHTTNNGIRQRTQYQNYARMIKQSLDRRRAQSGETDARQD